MKICPACATRFDSDAWICPVCGHLPANIDGYPALAPELAHAGGGFHPEYYSELAVLEAGNFWFRARNSLITELLRRHFPAIDSFLEIGCGTGFVLSGVAAACPSAKLTGTEIFSAGLGYAARRVPGAEFLQVDARHIPFENQFGLIGAFDVLEHIPEDEAVLVQMYQALKPGGGLMITVPQHAWLWSKQDEMACHVRRYSADELRRKVTEAGFTVQDMRSFVSLLLPLMWLSRIAGGLAGDGHQDALAELRMPPLLNRLLGGVMALERFLMQLGVRFMAGGSLLLIAKKGD